MAGDNKSAEVACSFCTKSAVNKRPKCDNCDSCFHLSCASKKSKVCGDNPLLSGKKRRVTVDQKTDLVQGSSSYAVEVDDEGVPWKRLSSLLSSSINSFGELTRTRKSNSMTSSLRPQLREYQIG